MVLPRITVSGSIGILTLIEFIMDTNLQLYSFDCLCNQVLAVACNKDTTILGLAPK